VTLSDVTFCRPCGGWFHNPQTANFEKKNFLLYANKMHGTLSMVDIAMDRLYVAKTEQLLAEREKGPDIGWQISNVKLDCMELLFTSKRTKR